MPDAALDCRRNAANISISPQALRGFAMVKRYFERELEEAGHESDANRIGASELVLFSLSAAIQGIPTQEKVERILADTPASLHTAEEWERFERFLEREGKKGWWD